MSPSFHIPYLLPTALLALALVLKLPTFLRASRDPDVRATTLLLVWATAVLVVITPVNIERLNDLTGVPNIASPWAYSFLTAFCATGLTMIMRWREAPSVGRRRRIRRIYWIYAGVVAVLWLTFVLADVPTARVYDLDTYYAGTPWMREHILLYIAAHTVSSLVAVSMLWKWFPEVANRWLKAGVVFLQLGFASGLVFDVAKAAAIGARWSGHDWDVLSTRAAPPFALLEAALVALGFIVPQVGPALQKWVRDQREYRRLGPLWHALRNLAPAAAEARFGPWTPLDLRLLQRRQRIHDALRLLGPYVDPALYRRAHEAARCGDGVPDADGVAGALAISAAVGAYRQGGPPVAGPREPQAGVVVSGRIESIASALHRPRILEDVRRRMTSTGSAHHHG
ncbi:MAB_1171c family putative transporter [Streptomyces sp. NPDC056353]|uniref:MAB_1171c family putative transporter n=1 Tax=Streptomyces TaxID=1883 RepID=UPI00285297E0|nr:MAB_1171c family putative transporter [Streptomyces salinarius]